MNRTKNSLESNSVKFYDPLYQVVVFSREGASGSLQFYIREKKKKSRADGTTHRGIASEEFLSILNSYELSRLNFLRQAPLAWLVFPSATHTRFAHSLGAWFLSEFAQANVFVLQKRKEGRDKSSHEDLVKLRTRLASIGWLEEFQLALLLHDVGHLPFSHVIESNDWLIEEYANASPTEGIELDHEKLGCALIEGDKRNRFFQLYLKYLKSEDSKFKTDDLRLLSNRLRMLDTVDASKITFFVDCDREEPPGSFPVQQRRFLRCVREIVSGVVDLDRMDHYHRDAHFVSSRVGEFNVQGLLHNMALVEEEKRDSDGNRQNEMHVQLFGDGIGHAFQMLYAKIELTDTAFNNVDVLAYEVMLNHALTRHWDSEKESSKFRKYFPFYDDSELMHDLRYSSDPGARRMIRRIRSRDPLTCVGKYLLDPESDILEGETRKERRQRCIAMFGRLLKVNRLKKDQCFLRIHKDFGKKEEDSEWMDLGEILSDDGRPLKDLENRKKFIDYYREMNALAARTYWVFVAVDDSATIDSGEIVGEGLGGKPEAARSSPRRAHSKA